MSSGGRRGALVELFRSAGASRSDQVVVTDMSQLSAAGHLADAFELVPPVNAPDFLSESLRIALLHGCTTVIPTIDPEIMEFASSREGFRQRGVDVWVSSPEVADLGWDKWAMYKWLRSASFPTMDTVEVRSFGGEGHFQNLMAKPRSGSASKGVLMPADISDLDFHMLSDDYIVQRFAPGIEVTVDVAVSAKGQVLATIPRRRLEVRAGEVSKGVTIKVPAIEELVRDLVQQLPGAYGILNVQVIYDPETDSSMILEINPRFGGGYPLSHEAGGDLIGAMLRSQEGEQVHLQWKPGVVMLRYDTAAYYVDEGYSRLPWQ